MIVKVGDGYLYDGEHLKTADDAYRKFRAEYNKSLGRVSYGMLGKREHRKERVHGSDLVFSEGHEFAEYPDIRIKAYFLGLAYECYCKTVGRWDIPYEIDDMQSWYDWAFRKGGDVLKVKMTRNKTGRTREKLIRRKR